MKRRNQAQRLRTAVELLPRHTREAMLRGIDSNEIIVGAYTDRDGGVCPMLAAHRNGGRTNFASFARAWDDFTHAKRPRRASRREIRALRSYIEMSLLADDMPGDSLVAIAADIRSARRAAAEPAAAERAGAGEPRPGDRNRAPELRNRRRWSWMRPTRRLDVFEATIAAASEQHAEAAADEVLDRPTETRQPHPAG
jgi:hypothetical protein